MAKKLSWYMNVQVEGGPRIELSNACSIEAFDRIELSLAPDETDAGVEIQPSEEKEKLQFFIICADRYGADLTYKLDKGDADTDAIHLDSPHVFTGKGAVGLFKSSPEKLFFTNKLTEQGPKDKEPVKVPVSIEILVCREAKIPSA